MLGSLHQGAEMPGTRSTFKQDWNYENNIVTESDYYKFTTLKFQDSGECVDASYQWNA